VPSRLKAEADLDIPVMDGFELLLALRAAPATAAIPVAVVTGKSLSPEERTRLAGQAEHALHRGDVHADDLWREVARPLESRALK